MSKTLSLLIILLLMPLASSATERVDPMRPDDQPAAVAQEKQATTPTATTPARINLWLQSIQIGAENRSATINGRLLKIGDKISGARLISIEHNQVKLRRDGKQIKLMFLPRTIKK